MTADRAVTDAAHNAVAVASLAWQEATEALRHILRTAHDHGLTVEQLAGASGLDPAYVTRLLEDAG